MTAESSRESFRLGKDGPTPEQYAAWKGASLAFGKPPVKPKPQMNTYSGTNGALAAATKVGANSRSASASRTPSMTRLEHSGDDRRLTYQRSGGSNTGSSLTPDFDRRFNYLERGNGFLQPQDQSKSPSFIAATLAASRSVTPNHTGQQQQQATLQRQSSFTRQRSPRSLGSVSSRTSLDQPLDTSSIPPTNSLIGIFEQNAAPKTKKRPGPRRSATAATETLSPKPQAPVSTRARTPSSRVEKPEIKSPKPILAPNFSNTPREAPVPLPAPRKSSTSVKPDPPKQLRAVRRASISASKPVPIPSKPRPRTVDDDAASSDDSFVSANDYKPSFRATLQSQNRRQQQSTSVNSSVAIDSLANAIVASSLASSRAASPSKPNNTLYPPPPPPRRNRHIFHTSNDISRTPSPAKAGLRTTMRKPKEQSEDEGEKRRTKKSLMKKHPHKHHEGDRKRWRDELTERERKRYEAVWASNRGLYTSGVPGAENAVCSLVARDIYSRSRLHADVLEEVYALVDRQGNGMLGKEEFVVGLWLIDQRLKGRKLPIRVTDSVWRSVGILSSIKVRKVR